MAIVQKQNIIGTGSGWRTTQLAKGVGGGGKGPLGGVPGNSPPCDGGGCFDGAALGEGSGGEVHSEGLSAMAGRLNVPSPQQQQQQQQQQHVKLFATR